MSLDVDREFEALNHGSGWPRGKPKACMIHATRSGQARRTSLAGHRLETRSTINWFKSSASRASTNLIVSPLEIVRMVSDDDYAWHAKEHSDWTYSVEVTQALPSDPYLDGHYELLGRAGRHYVSLGVPPVYLPHFSNGMEGFTGHEDSEQGVRDGKSDPGPEFDWPRFIASIQEPASKEDDMKPFLAWDRDRQRIYLVGPWGASWIVTAKDVKKFGEMYGKLEVGFGKETLDALDQKVTIPAL